MSEIEDIVIRKILDSRGKPTVEVEVWTMEAGGMFAAPSGASTGEHEAVAVPKAGLDAAMELFENELAPKVMGLDVFDQEGIDDIIRDVDGTDDLSRIGGNLAVALSIASSRAAAESLEIPYFRYLGGMMACDLPYPMGNVIGGGKHAIGGTDIQEFLAISQGETFRGSAFAGAAVHAKVAEMLKKRYPDRALGKGDEGAWVASIANEEALEVLFAACQEVSDEVGFPVQPGLDLASSSFYKKDRYVYADRKLDRDGQIAFVGELVDKYELFSVEDPLWEEDYEGYSILTENIGDRCLVIGDDIFVTNVERLERGIEEGSCNAILIKPNQIGTLTDTMEAVRLARDAGYQTVISHRSGETTDSAIAHMGVAFGSICIKTGAVSGERIAKLNELMRIEEIL
ncbi:MAG: phosphopyruvate hydratase [Candidatus Thermoplasmatota archaeon]|nr:phosphopyruvate hydratase [Candidatus Thermoplasmatota archaeon]